MKKIFISFSGFSLMIAALGSLLTCQDSDAIDPAGAMLTGFGGDTIIYDATYAPVRLAKAASPASCTERGRAIGSIQQSSRVVIGSSVLHVADVKNSGGTFSIDTPSVVDGDTEGFSNASACAEIQALALPTNPKDSNYQLTISGILTVPTDDAANMNVTFQRVLRADIDGDKKPDAIAYSIIFAGSQYGAALGLHSKAGIAMQRSISLTSSKSNPTELAVDNISTAVTDLAKPGDHAIEIVMKQSTSTLMVTTVTVDGNAVLDGTTGTLGLDVASLFLSTGSASGNSAFVLPNGPATMWAVMGTVPVNIINLIMYGRDSTLGTNNAVGDSYPKLKNLKITR